MNATEFDDLASRWVVGDQLATDEEHRLLDWLEKQPNARVTLLQDEALDSLLCSLAEREENAEEFVKGCLRRAAAQAAAAVVEAPPIVAPPRMALSELPATGVVSRPSTPFTGSSGMCHPASSRRPSLAKAVRWTAVIVGCCAAMVLAAIGWQWFIGGRQAVQQNQVAANSADDPAARHEPPGAFARLAQCTADAAWNVPRSEGDWLAAEELKLTAGMAELHFDKGTVVRLTAPATLELRSPDDVFLKSGTLSAQVPRPAVGFAVTTSMARIVDLGTEFDVTVKDPLATETFVHRGRISVRSRIDQEALGEPIELTAAGLDTATVSMPNVAVGLPPVTVVARGSTGRFLARMTAQGKTAEFRSQAALDAFRTEALKQLGQSPAQFAQEWPALVAAAKSGAVAENAHPVEHRQPPPKTVPVNPGPAPGSTAANHHGTGGHPANEEQTVEIEENGKKVSITDSKELGITVTITESVNGTKKTTKVRAADTAELAKKDPEAHKFYRKYFHPRPKNGKPK